MAAFLSEITKAIAALFNEVSPEVVLSKEELEVRDCSGVEEIEINKFLEEIKSPAISIEEFHRLMNISLKEQNIVLSFVINPILKNYFKKMILGFIESEDGGYASVVHEWLSATDKMAIKNTASLETETINIQRFDFLDLNSVMPPLTSIAESWKLKNEFNGMATPLTEKSVVAL